jgi:hypothetical protein
MTLKSIDRIARSSVSSFPHDRLLLNDMITMINSISQTNIVQLFPGLREALRLCRGPSKLPVALRKGPEDNANETQ